MRDDTASEVFPIPWVTEAGVVGFFCLALGLVAARPDYDPVTRYISEYAVGPGGWAMRAAFILLGLASLNLVPGFVGDGRSAPVGAGRATRWLGWSLGVWGAAVLVAAVFPVDLQGAPMTTTGGVHLLAAVAGFLALFVAMALAARAFRDDERWQDLAGRARAVAVATPAAFVLEGSVFSSVGWVGLGQWLLFGLAGGWVLLVGRRVGRVSRDRRASPPKPGSGPAD